jgi:uncharacterized protein (DUF924 family)
MTDAIAAIHEFWFGELDDNGLCSDNRHSRWFGADEETDAACRSRFGPCLEQALRGELVHWADTDHGLVALVVLLDQFSRNIYRGTAMAFAGDDRALALARDAIESGQHLALPAIHRVFLYLPLEHCEDLDTQDRCVALFEALEDGTDHPQFAGFTRYAVAHREVIARFGRFPHRNALLGRDSSAEELTYMEQHGGF